MLSGLRCPPRFGTDRDPDFPTLGEGVARTALAVHRSPFMEHQRHIADVSQELDPTTGLRRYSTVVLIGPRQGTGKTHTVEAQLVMRTAAFANTTSLYLAQDRLKARVRLLEELELRRLRRSPATAGRYTARLSNGSEAINWHNGSKIAIDANTSEAGHGLTLNGDVFVDEAWAHPGLTVVQGVSPTMLTCPDPQLWIVSAMGDGTDGLLMHYQDIGLAAIHDPDSRVAYFEWSRDDGADPSDPATWEAVIPGLGTTCTIQDVRDQLVNLGVVEFDRAMLSVRPTSQTQSRIPAQAWARQYRGRDEALPQPPYVLTVDVAWDRSRATIAVVAPTAAGELVAIVDERAGTSWVIGELERLQTEHRPGGIWIDRRSPAGSLIDRIVARGVVIREPDTVQFTASAGVFYDGVVETGDVVHLGQPELDTAVSFAATRPLGDTFAWNRRDSRDAAGRPVNISSLCAVSLAVWAHRHQYPTGSPARIY